MEMPIEVTEHPFSVLEFAQEVTLTQSRERVFDVLTAQIGEWFTPRFVSGSKVIAEPWAGGRIYEQNEDGTGVLWDVCTAYMPPSYVSYESPWGFAGGSATIIVTYKLTEADDGGTLINSKHRILGYTSDQSRKSYEQHMDGPMGLQQLLDAYFAKNG
jgi:uncharacterized protein YndB with AHSA1/START domain